MTTALNIEALDEFLSFYKDAAAASKKKKSTTPKAPKAPAFKPIEFPKNNDLKKTQKKELELWHHWNDNGRKKEHLTPLLNSMKPLIQKHVGAWRGVEIPSSTIHSEFRKQFVQAVKTYDPSKSALNSWVHKNLLKGTRYLKKYQNLGKIPEGQIKLITPYKKAYEHLTNLHGFEPDTKTIADHMGEPVKRIAQLQKELRKDNSASGYSRMKMEDPAEIYSPKELEALHMIKYDNRLSTEDRTVYEYTYGLNGRPQLAPGQISKQTGIHPSKVSRIRTKLKGVLQEALEVL